MSDVTVLDRLDRQAKEYGDRPAVADPRGGRYDAWDTLSWREYAQRVEELARAFVALGHQPKDAVGIMGSNSIAWVLADLAAIAAGGMPAGIYSTVTAEQVEYILSHARASIAVVQDEAMLSKVLAALPRLEKLKAIVLFPGRAKPAGAPAIVHTWDEALAKAKSIEARVIQEIRSQAKPEDPATLIYTSGTTGPPKAVALSHRNLTWTADVAKRTVDARQGDRGVSYLPLSHIAEQMLTIHVPITVGVTIHFVPVMENLADALRAVRPTVLFGVPRVWEKIQGKVEAGVASAPPARQKLFRAARKIGLAVNQARFEDRQPAFGPALVYPLFERLVYSKLRDRLGLDQARICVSGAAPLSAGTRDWFLSLGVPISEVYGQSEGCGPTSFNLAGKGKLGTVGKPLEGVEVKIAQDGEILVRGPNVFLGYLHDEKATKETLTPDGFLCSGDVGELDKDGFLKITDRKKDLLITAGGKNVAPQNIERELCSLPMVAQAVVVGDQQKYLVALLTLRPEVLEAFAKTRGIDGPDPEARARHPAVRAELEKEIQQKVNPKLAKYETIKRFEILPRELSEAAGELTPTQKIKRKVVYQRYAEEIRRLYSEGGAPE